MTRSKTYKYRKKRNSKFKPQSLALTLGATALLLVGGGLAYFLFQNRGSSGPLPMGSDLLPPDTSSSLTLSLQANQRDRLQSFNIPQTRRVILDSLNAFEIEVLEPHGLTYENNIKPWAAAKITSATLTPEAQSSEALAPISKAWILPVRNGGQANRFLEEGLTQGGSTVTQSAYQTIAIKTLQSGSESLFLAMAANNFMVMTNDMPSMREIIDTLRTENSLAVQDRFKGAMEEIQSSNPLAVIYLNVPENTSQIFEQEGRQIDQSTLERLQEFQGLGSSVELTNKGLKFNAISWLNPDTAETLTVTGAAQDMAAKLPEDTLLMMSGDNFKQVWDDYQKGVETQLLLPFSPKSLQSSFTEFTGLDFEKQFVSWMTGDFAAGVVPSAPGNTQNAGVVFMVKTRDKTAAEQAMKELETQMQEKFSLQISETKVNDRAVNTWRLPPNLPVASRGWLGDKVLFFTMFAPITDQILAPEKLLADTGAYQGATQSELSPKSGRLFFNVPQLAKLMSTSQYLPKLTPEYEKYAKEFESIGATSTTLNDWSTRYEVNVNFVKK